MDRALLDRFVTVEMDELEYEDEVALLKLLYPDADINMLGTIGEITTHTRKVVKSAESKITDSLSTRSAVEMVLLMTDSICLKSQKHQFILTSRMMVVQILKELI